MRYIERRGEARMHGKKELPWLRHKFLLVELWTGAYMLDSWEALAIFLVPTIIVAAVIYRFAFDATAAVAVPA